MRTLSEFEKLQNVLNHYKRGLMTSREYLAEVAIIVEAEVRAEVTIEMIERPMVEATKSMMEEL